MKPLNKVLINKEIKKKLMGVIDINNKLVESNLKLKNMYDFNKKLINDSMNMQKRNSELIRLNTSIQKENNELLNSIKTNNNFNFPIDNTKKSIVLEDLEESSSEDSDDNDSDSSDIELSDIIEDAGEIVKKNTSTKNIDSTKVNLDLSIFQKRIDKKLKLILTKIDILKKSKVYLDDFKMKELKKENIIVDIDFARRMLEFKDHRSIIYIMKKYYKSDINEKILYPIKYKQNHGFDYFNKGRWIHDTYGEILIDILFCNFKALFMKCNDFDAIKVMNKFIENQTFIQQLNNIKFKRNFARYLKNELISNDIE